MDSSGTCWGPNSGHDPLATLKSAYVGNVVIKSRPVRSLSDDTAARHDVVSRRDCWPNSPLGQISRQREMGGKLGRIGESYDCSRSRCGRLTVPSGPTQTRTRFCDSNDHL